MSDRFSFRCVRCGADRGGVIDLRAAKPALTCLGCANGLVSVTTTGVKTATGCMPAGLVTPTSVRVRSAGEAITRL